MNRRIPLAPAEGWLTLGLVVVMCLTAGLGDRRRRAGSSAGRSTSTCLVLAAIGGVLAGFIGAEGRLGPLADLPDRIDLRGAARAAARRRCVGATGRRLDPRPVRDHRRRRSSRPTSTWPSSTCRSTVAVPPLHLSCSGCSSGRPRMFASYAVFGHHRPLNAVIVVGIVLVGNMAFTLDDQLQLPRPVQHRLAVPAHPLARLRRAGRMAPPPDRRSGDDLVGLPARRDHVHHGRGHLRRFFLTQTAASRRWPAPGTASRTASSSLSRSVSRFLPTGGSTRAGRAELREQHAGPAVVELRPWRGDDHPARPEGHDRVLLARLHL